MAELTAELIADLAAPADVQLSPDRRRVAYVLLPYSKKDEHGSSAIWIAGVAARTDCRLQPTTSYWRRAMHNLQSEICNLQ